MSMSDPVADMLTHIRNGQQAGKTGVRLPASKLKTAIAQTLREEGYIEGHELVGSEQKTDLSIKLRYHSGKPVIGRIQRVSRPGLRVYRSAQELPRVIGGLGVAIISTSHGVMTDQAARAAGHGGEVLCVVE